jgi:aryl sulfotransferase
MKAYKTAVFDNSRWEGFKARPDDVFVCTPPKCGTTWTQTIVVNLFWPDGDPPGSVMELSPWIEADFTGPSDNMHAALEAQTHRRVIKSHTPADGIPWFDQCKYLFVCRDGLDAFMSMINHISRMKMLDAMNEQALADGVPPLPSYDGDVHKFFDHWLDMETIYFDIVGSYVEQRNRSNLLFVHFNDLKKDLSGEMKRTAEFLNIEISEAQWPQVVDRCTFESMRSNEGMVGDMSMGFEGGTKGFLHKGTNGRWHDQLNEEEVQRYLTYLADAVPADAIDWVRNGGRI